MKKFPQCNNFICPHQLLGNLYYLMKLWTTLAPLSKHKGSWIGSANWYCYQTFANVMNA